MNRPDMTQADKRVPIALGMLTAVLALLGASQMTLQAAGTAGRPMQMASASLSSPGR